jgi:hypothetical protein
MMAAHISVSAILKEVHREVKIFSAPPADIPVPFTDRFVPFFKIMGHI